MWIESAAMLLAMELMSVMVSSVQGRVRDSSRWPPQRSTTFSPSLYTQTAAPISPRPAKFSRNVSSTNEKSVWQCPSTLISTILIFFPQSDENQISRVCLMLELPDISYPVRWMNPLPFGTGADRVYLLCGLKMQFKTIMRSSKKTNGECRCKKREEHCGSHRLKWK